MTTTVAFSQSADGYVTAGSTVYNDAVNGAGATAVAPGGNEGVYGLGRTGSTYDVFETFLSFAYSVPSNEVVTAAVIGVRHSQHQLGAPVSAMMWTQDWGASVDAGDWFNPLDVFGSTRAFRLVSAEFASTTQDSFAGSDDLVTLLRTTSSPYRFVLVTDRQLIYDVNNTSDEWHAIWLSETALDPALVVSSTPASTLHGVMGAQVQLSDGTWMVLESNGAATPTVLLRHVDTAGTATTKATIPTGETAGHLAVQPGHGAQQLALVVDSSDNLFVLGREGTTENNLAIKAYNKGSGYSWTPQTTVVAGFGSWDNNLNNFAGAWHSVGGGTLVVFATRTSSDGYHAVTGYEGAWHIIDATVARTATGTLLRATGTMVGQFTPAVSPYVWAAPMNDTGSGMDVTALSSTKGALHSWSRLGQIGDNQQTTKARYILNSSGTAFASVFTDTPTSGSAATWGVKTGASKLRIIPVSADTTVTVSADSDSAWGLTVGALRNTGSSSSWTLLGRVRLSNESLSTMPSAATLAESHAWDAAYVTGPNKIWVYYFDTADGRRLMRTAVSMNTYTATREEVEVNATVGASGSTNLAVRVARGSGTPRRSLIAVANRTSGGTLSTIYIVDTPNEAPTAPTLASRSNFDGNASASFDWSFNDPDIGDTQTSFQLDVNTASGVDEFDTGQTSGTTGSYTLAASTLASPGSWQWRVRTWDEAGASGAWSTYAAFSTGVGGTVTVTDPVADNPSNFIVNTYPVAWSLAGATQADYRVEVYRTDTEALVYTSGWVTSADVTHTVTGLLSDVEQRIEVTTRTALAVESQTGTRLVTPDFDSPDQPSITVTEVPDEGHTSIVVTNPSPTGSKPSVTYAQILRRALTGLAAGDDWTVIGAVVEDGTWKDYTAASQITYEYLARAVSADDTTTDSDTEQATLDLQGVWIHDPVDPAEADDSAYQFRYGSVSGKGLGHDTMGVGAYYAGRQYPVYDFGEHDAEELSAAIQIEHGPTWIADVAAVGAFARAKTTLCVRDTRGRRVFGTVTYSESDEQWGTSIQVTVTRVDYDETYTTIPS